MRLSLVLRVLLLLPLGCGTSGPKFVPVTGTVTLDGNPLANAQVSFVPDVPERELDSTLVCTGKTNEKGEYSLSNFQGQIGAPVGKYRVMITCKPKEAGTGDERRPADYVPPVDKVSSRYNLESDLKFDVPPGGAKQASFLLSSQ